MEWPADGRVNLRALGLNGSLDRGVASVSVLGANAPLEWVRNETGLLVTLPAARPCAEAFTVKVTLK
jgi:hypothetical protein